MNKVICIGSTSKDIFFPTKEGMIIDTPKDVTSQKKIAFEMGAKYHINDRFESLGGAGANQACGLSRLGISAYMCTALGNDEAGKWMKEKFSERGINLDLVEIINNCLSGLSAIIVDENNGERIIFSNQEANERLQVDLEKLSGADFISVTDLSGDWKGVIERVIKFCVKENIKFSFNPRGINIKEDPAKVFEFAGKSEIFFVNKDEAIEVVSSRHEAEGDTNLNDETYLLKKLKESGAEVVAITDGEKGAWASDGKNAAHVRAVKVKSVVDTTGAGDAFASAFLAAYIKGKSLEECLWWGVKNGASVVKFYGGVKGLLKEAEIV